MLLKLPKSLLKSSSLKLTFMPLLSLWGVLVLLAFIVYWFFQQSLWEQAYRDIEECAGHYYDLATEMDNNTFLDLLKEDKHFSPGISVELVSSNNDINRQDAAHDSKQAGDLSLSEEFVFGNDIVLRFSKDASLIYEVESNIKTTLFCGLLTLLLLIIFISHFLARKTFFQIENICYACNEIIEGHLSRRIAKSGTADDFDCLATHINIMMDKMESLLSDLRQVTDDIAHDLRTPLTRIRSQLELLAIGSSHNSIEIEHVIGEVDRLQRILDSLLRISRLEGGVSEQTFQKFDIKELIINMDELYRPTIENKEIDFICVMPDHGIIINGDPALWNQALANLLDNAIKYTPSGGKIEMSLTMEDKAFFQIKDTGPGIPFHERDNVFKRFYRLEKHRLTEGNGLGLSLVKAICELHDATISLSGNSGLIVTIKAMFP